MEEIIVRRVARFTANGLHLAIWMLLLAACRSLSYRPNGQPSLRGSN